MIQTLYIDLPKIENDKLRKKYRTNIDNGIKNSLKANKRISILDKEGKELSSFIKYKVYWDYIYTELEEPLMDSELSYPIKTSFLLRNEEIEKNGTVKIIPMFEYATIES